MVSTFLFLLAVNHSANFKRLQENLNHVIIINELIPKFLDRKTRNLSCDFTSDFFWNNFWKSPGIPSEIPLEISQEFIPKIIRNFVLGSTVKNYKSHVTLII